MLNISRIGNQYMQAKKPWALVKGSDEEKEKGATVIGLCINIGYLLSVLIYPYMPNISAVIRRQLNVPVFKVTKESETPEAYDGENIKPCEYEHPVFFNKFYQFVKEGHVIGKAEPLFKRILEADVKVWKEKFGGVQEKKPDEKEAKGKKKEKPKVKKEKPAENSGEEKKKEN